MCCGHGALQIECGIDEMLLMGHAGSVLGSGVHADVLAQLVAALLALVRRVVAAGPLLRPLCRRCQWECAAAAVRRLQLRAAVACVGACSCAEVVGRTVPPVPC